MAALTHGERDEAESILEHSDKGARSEWVWVEATRRYADRPLDCSVTIRRVTVIHFGWVKDLL